MKRISTILLSLLLILSCFAGNIAVADARDSEPLETTSIRNNEQPSPRDDLPVIARTDNLDEYLEATAPLYEKDYQALDKLEPEKKKEYQSGRVLVLGEPDYTGFSPEAIVQNPSGYYVIQFAEADEATRFVETQQHNSNVEWVERDILQMLDLPDYEATEITGYNHDTWGEEFIEAPQMVDYVKEKLAIADCQEVHTKTAITPIDEFFVVNRKAIVAVVDTGVDTDHILLKDHIYRDKHGNIIGKGFTEDGDGFTDVYGHGTHVSGIIVQSVEDLNVYIMPVRVFRSDGTGFNSIIALGVDYAVDNGADVINMSFGGGITEAIDSSEVLHYTVNNAVDAGCVACIAAGNEAMNTTLTCPAHIGKPGAITVSALSDQNNYEVAYFSNYGRAVDVAAPGCFIHSSIPDDINHTATESWSGTSMAAPFVSATAAMIKLLYPDMSAQEVENLIRHSTVDTGDVGKDDKYGYGSLKLSKFIESDRNPSAVIIIRQPQSLTVKAGSAARFTVEASGDLYSCIWQYRENENSEWIDVPYPYRLNNECRFIAEENYDNYQFRCLIDSPAGKLYSDTVTLNVELDENVSVLDSGNCGMLHWEVSDDYLLQISGRGEIPDFMPYEAPWYIWHDYIQKVVMPDVTRIGDYAFYGFSKMVVATDDLFHGCIGMLGLALPDEVTAIGEGAFLGCEKLSEAIFNNRLTYIGDYAFCGSGLINVSIPDSVTYIGEGAFALCLSLTNIHLSRNIKSISKKLFMCCTKLTSIVIPEGVEEINSLAFVFNYDLQSITIPRSMRIIYNTVFLGCNSLTDVYYQGYGMEEWEAIIIFDIDNDPLFEARLHLATLASGRIDNGFAWNIYNHCLNIYGEGDMPDYPKAEDYPWFEYRLQVYKISITEDIETISTYAFARHTNVEDVEIPCTINTIKTAAFDQCTSLSFVSYNDSLAQWDNIEIADQNDCLINAYEFSYVYNYSVFWSITRDGKLTINTNRMDIPSGNKPEDFDWYRYHDQINEIYLCDNIKSVGSYAFSEYDNLKAIRFPYHFDEIKPYAFSGSDNITDVYCVNSLEAWYTLNKGEGNESLDNVTVHSALIKDEDKSETGLYCTLVDGKLTIYNTTDAMRGIPSYETVDPPWYAYLETINELEIKEKIESAGRRAFRGCSNITKATFAADFFLVNTGAFHDCTKLADIYYYGECWDDITYGGSCFPDNAPLWEATVHHIGILGNEITWEFLGNTLSIYGSGDMPNNETDTDPWFRWHKAIRFVNIDEGITAIGNNTFIALANEIIFNLPNSLTRIGKNSFTSCGMPYYLVLPENLKVIEDAAFTGCDGLTDIVIPAGIEFIGPTAFDHTRLDNVFFQGTEVQWQNLGELNRDIESAEKYYNYTAPIIVEQPGNIVTTPGEQIDLEVIVKAVNPQYQWYYRNNPASEWAAIAENNSSTYSFTATQADDGKQYRCEITDEIGTSYSDISTIGVAYSKPVITQQPKSFCGLLRTTARLSVKATGGNLHYQWEYRKPNSSIWLSINGANSAEYQFTLTKNNDGNRYHCIISNEFGTVISNEAFVSTVRLPFRPLERLIIDLPLLEPVRP